MTKLSTKIISINTKNNIILHILNIYTFSFVEEMYVLENQIRSYPGGHKKSSGWRIACMGFVGSKFQHILNLSILIRIVTN
jgi:hypothetical protein